MAEDPEQLAARKKAGVVRRSWAFFRDPTVATWRKLGGLFAAGYVLFPFDLITDLIPVVGWLDDVGVVGATAWLMMKQIDRHAEKRAAAGWPTRDRLPPQA